MRVPLLAANWKMYMTRREATHMVEDLVAACEGVSGREVLICPPFPLLAEIGRLLQGRNYHLGGQNLHWEEFGAYTGEVSAPMLRDVGCSHVIVGHSERRAYFGETDATCRKKVTAALAQGLIPVLCVGETLEQREAGETRQVVVTQLRGALEGVSLDSGSRLVLAYEPVWAIGTGKNATPADAEETMAVLRAELASIYGERIANQIRILYGGSVKPDNIDDLMAQKNIDGALVGGASLKADSFARIVSFQTAAQV
ncbi:MAG: triose-phosphate isomerase [Armatimonadetes bacterium]|nr:triose-phosphate isomerase [Armatimonadota bacterium]